MSYDLWQHLREKIQQQPHSIAPHARAVDTGATLPTYDTDSMASLLIDKATGRLLVAATVSGGSGGTEYTEDAASAGGESGGIALGVRRDADTSSVTTDGDFQTMLFNSLGYLKVINKGVIDIATDDIIIGAQFDDASITTATEDQFYLLRMTSFRGLHTNLRNNSGTEIGTSTTPLIANNFDAAATTGTITAVDAATSSTSNSISQTIITGTPTANSSVSVTMSGQTVVTLQLSGTASTTCAFERSMDGGTTFVPFSMEEVAVGSSVSSLSMTDNKAYVFRSSAGGMTTLRVRCTTYTSGTVTVRWLPSWGVGQFPVNQGIANSITNGWPVKVTDGTNSMPTGDASARTIHTTIDNANVATNIAQLAGNTVSSGVGASGTGTFRVVNANDVGRTLLFLGGSAASSGDNTIVAAGTNKLKVYSLTLSTVSTTAVTCILKSGAAGTEIWRCVLQAPSNVGVGVSKEVTPPAYLFATAAATLLNLNLSGAITVHWAVSYFDEA